MDIGQLKNPFSSKKKEPAGSGLFKIGDYDEPQRNPSKNTQADEPNLATQAGESMKNGAENAVNKVTGNDDSPQKST